MFLRARWFGFARALLRRESLFGLASALVLAGAIPAAAETFVVNSTVDAIDDDPGDGQCATTGGLCTLRAAVMEANALPGADTILVPAGVFTLSLSPGAVEPPEPPEIEVPLAGCLVTESGDWEGDLDITCQVTIIGAGRGLTIVEAGPPPPNASPEQLANDRVLEIHTGTGNVLISDMTIRNGWSSDEGGGIWNGSVGTLRLFRVEVQDNVSTAYGGGIFSQGNLTIESSTLSGNATFGKGGAIFSNQGTLTVRGLPGAPTTFSNNSADTGGGIYNGGELSMIGVASRVNLSHVAFHGNHAGAGGGVFGDQGGVINVDDCSFTANYAEDNGAGIAVVQKTSLTMNRVTVIGNNSAGEGGGVRTDTERMVRMTDVDISHNHAGVPVVQENGTVEQGDASGGGLCAAGSGAVEITRSTFSHNTATEEGGGIYIDNNGSVVITDSNVFKNHAHHGGGGIQNAGMRVTFQRMNIYDNVSDLDGGGIESQGSGDFTILDCNIFNNTAENGGGLANAADGRFLLGQTSVFDNRARIGESDDTGLGGGIYVLGDSGIRFENVTVSGNKAQVRGGGVFIDADADTKIANCTITLNEAPAAAGLGGEVGSINFPIMPSTAVVLRNTIIANNRVVQGPMADDSAEIAAGILPDQCSFALGSQGGNIDTGNSCHFAGPRDRNNAKRVSLDALSNNGGFVYTHAVRDDSMAIDAGVGPGLGLTLADGSNIPPILMTDARGVSRPKNGRVDVGAYEHEGPYPDPDFVPPDTTFISGPVMQSLVTSIFVFSGTDDVSPADELFFECRLIEFDPLEPPEPPDPTAPPDPTLAWVGCSSPWEVKLIEDGFWKFEVRAFDSAGNVDPTPVVHEFEVEPDFNPPETFFLETPSNPSTLRSATFTFGATDAETPPHLMHLVEFECRIDTNDPDLWLECPNPMVFTNLSTGMHTVQVRAADLADNIDPSPATFTWEVLPPSTCNQANVSLTAMADGVIDEFLFLENFVIMPQLNVRSAAGGNNSRVLVQFGVPNDLPSSCDLISATLRLYSSGGDGGRTLEAWRLAGPWQENTVTWANQPATIGTPVTAPSSGSEGYREWNVTSHVQAILNGGTDYGWLIKDANESDAEGAETTFLSREVPQDPPPVTLPRLVLRFANNAMSDPPPPPPPPTAATVETEVYCGMYITESIRLANDLIGCTGEGLIIGASNIHVDLNGHTISSGLFVDPGQEDGLPAGIRNSSHDNVHITNGTVSHFGYGVRLLGGATFNVVENMTFHANLIAGVELLDADDGQIGNTIRNNLFTANGETGITISFDSENSVIEGNQFLGNSGFAILLMEAHGHLIHNNVVSGVTDLSLATGSDGGIRLESSFDNIITNNSISDAGDAGVYLTAGSHRNRIENNIMIRPGDGGVIVDGSDEIWIIDNLAHLSSDAGVILSNSNHNIVRGNDLQYNPGGIDLGGSSHNLIENNNVSFSGAAGIGIGSGSLNNLILHNNASHTGATGIDIEAEAFDAQGNPITGNLVLGNTANGNLGDGISVASGGHTVTDNTAHNNFSFGIRAGDFVVDGGGNTGRGNAEPEQCEGVVCGEGTPVPPLEPDMEAPDTFFTQTPPNQSGQNVVFRFSGSDNRTPVTALRYECRLDPGPDPTPEPPEPPDPPEPGQPPDLPDPIDPTDPDSWTECSSPVAFKFLAAGEHTFQVRAIDFELARRDFTHASYTWTVIPAINDDVLNDDDMPPRTTLVSGPSNPSITTSATFTFRGTDNLTPGRHLGYQCRLNSDLEEHFVPCTSPMTYTGLGLGTHTFEVRAIDLAGNVDQSPELKVWTIIPPPPDTTPPMTSIDAGPDVRTVLTDATFIFSSDEAGSSFECALDNEPFAPCTSPKQYTGLSVDTHEFFVRATDAAGNTDPSPALAAWSIGPAPVPTVVNCGDVLTTSVLLLNDLVDCAGHGLVVGAHGITIDLNGHFIIGTGLGAGVFNDGFDYVTVTNGAIAEFDYGVQFGPGTAFSIVSEMTIQLNALGGIEFAGGNANIIRDNGITNNSFAGVALINGTQGTLVRDNIIGANPGAGVYMFVTNGNRIEGNNISNSSEAGILLEGASVNTIVGNFMVGNAGESIAITLVSHGNRVTDNMLFENEMGILVQDSNGNELLDNIAMEMGGPGVELYNTQHTVIKGNEVRFNSGGISLRQATNTLIENNIVTEVSGTGISLQDSSLSNTIIGNRVNFNASGIYVADQAAGGTGNMIENNIVNGNDAGGISVTGFGHVIGGNQANDNGGWGIYAVQGSAAQINIDMGHNRAVFNGELGQCFGVVCDGGPPLVTDTVAPETMIMDGPAGNTSKTWASFKFAGIDNISLVTFECRLDSFLEEDFIACSSPTVYSGLGLGEHTFEVRAIDRSGNKDDSPAVYFWTIDALEPGVPPETMIDSHPPIVSAAQVATFTFSSNEPDVTFECALDPVLPLGDEDFAPCGSPIAFDETDLLVGKHAFYVRAVDVESLPDPTPALWKWVITAAGVPTTVNCGMVLTQSTLVLNNLENCAGNGLVVGAEGILIDLNGKTIDGTGQGAGVFNNGFDSIIITNGHVQEFDYAVQLNPGSDRMIVSKINGQLNQNAGILLDGTTLVTVQNNTLINNFDGILLQNGSTSSTIVNNTLSLNTGTGIYLLASTGNRLEGNDVSGTSESAISLEGSSGNNVINNTISSSGSESMTIIAGSNDNHVIGNNLTAGSGGIVIEDSNGTQLVFNVVQQMGGDGITLYNAHNSLIRGNDVRHSSSGIELELSTGNRIESNNTSQLNGTGITLGSGSLNNVVVLNSANFNNSEGIAVSDQAPAGQGNLIDRNTANGNGGGGIDVSSPGHTVVGNKANFNDGWGIFAAQGTIDGGNNYALGNAEPAQCFEIACIIGEAPGAPDTTIVHKPSLTTSSSAAMFTFSGTDDTTALVDLSFECRLDSTNDLDWIECENPQIYTNLAPGVHLFEVRAMDLMGLVDPTPAQYQWTYVPLPPGSAPDTTINIKPPLQTPLLEAVFTFSSNEEDVTFQCSLDNEPFTPCGFLDLEFPVSFGATEYQFEEFQVGPHQFRVRAIDNQGNIDPTPAVYDWTILGLLTTITNGPAFTPPVEPGEPAEGGETTDTFATFAFEANIADATFFCSIDFLPFEPCVSPVTYNGLAVGGHLFRVYAVDGDGREELEPVEYEWVVMLSLDVTPPNTIIVSGPADGSDGTTFVFSGTDDQSTPAALTYECALDSNLEADFFSCTNPFNILDELPEFALLPAGPHVLYVRAIDGEDNIDPTPASHPWNAVPDSTPPLVTILTGPAGTTLEVDAQFTFIGTDTSSPQLALTYECAVDSTAEVDFEPCSSPAGVSGMTGGEHTFYVRAVDLAGNRSSPPASFTWFVVVPPVTTIVSGPPATTISTTATFEFTADQSPVTFACSLDGADFVPCTSPYEVTNLGGGGHEFEVQATNNFGLVEASPPSYQWTVNAPPDTTPPNTTINSGPPAITLDTTATFTFSADEPFVTFECALDLSSYSNCMSPHTLTGVPVGSHVFRVRATDASGNVDPTPAEYPWTIDGPPVVTILTGPPEDNEVTFATFTFESNKPGSTFECWLDGNVSACTSPVTYTGIGVGQHLFAVRATANGLTGDWVDWEFDVLPPEPPNTTFTLDGTPPSNTDLDSATFGFTGVDTMTATEDLTFQCRLRLNGTEPLFESCTSPKAYGGLPEGTHTFEVRAIDQAGNIDPTPASYTWTITFPIVDFTAPDSVLLFVPPEQTFSTNAEFTFSANEPEVTFKCSLDNAEFTSCTSPVVYSNLSVGSHTFRVIATDAANNTQSTPTSYTWLVAAIPDTPPETAITQKTVLNGTTSAQFTFSGTDAQTPVSMLTYECRLDSVLETAWAPCTSPKSYTGINTGSHTFEVRAVDGAGNRDPSPASFAWTIVTVSANADAWVDQNSASNNFGSDSTLKVQCKSSNNNMRAYFRFNLPTKPAGYSVHMARLRIFSPSWTNGRTLHARRVSANWAENTIRWNNQPASEASFTATSSGQGYREWLVAQQVEDMYSMGNHGFMVRDSVENTGSFEQQFHSREKGQSVPQLVIVFGASGG